MNEDEERDLPIEVDDEPTDNEITRQKIHIASGVICSVLFLMFGTLVLDAVSQVRQWHYTVPSWFCDICKMTIGSAMVVLGLGGLGALQNLINRK